MEKIIDAKKMKEISSDLLRCLLSMILAVAIGLVVGVYSSLFGIAVGWVTDFRLSHEWLMYLMPVGGLMIVAIYRLFKVYNPQGTNLVIKSISSGEPIPLPMLPLITISTIITHFFGGSAGREGAAIQIGGSLGMQFGRVLKLNQHFTTIAIMSGMSAAFSALFGTPLTAAIFAIEVIAIGIMHYSLLVPCAFSAYTAYIVAKHIGVKGLSFPGITFPEFNIVVGLKTIVFGIACAVVGILFWLALRYAGKVMDFIKNKYLRSVIGAAVIILLTLAIGSKDYLGLGSASIANAMNGTAVPYAFALKIIFTAITLAACFKGGEIVPTIFIGATFGCVFAPLIGLPASAGAAMGVCGLFCAVTNCPITSILLSLELFGADGLPLFVIAIAVSYRLSGYVGLYSGQKIMYSKSIPKFINIQTKH